MVYEHKSYKYLYYLLMGFNLLTLILYLSNPFLNNSGNHGLTLLYISINLLFLGWGYKSGLKKGRRINSIPRKAFLSDVSHNTLQVYTVFYVLTFLLKYAYELHCPPFDIGALVNRIILGIVNPYLGYTTGGSYRPFGWSIYTIICFFDSVFFIVGMLSWRKLKKGEKYLFVVLSVIELFKGMGSGSSFGELKMITTLAIILLMNLKEIRLTRKQKSVIWYSVAGAFFLALFIFSHNMTGRSGGELSDTFGESLGFNNDSFINKYLISIFPDSIKNLYVYICHYICNGYYNLEYAFNCNFEWTYFLGSNDAKTHLFNVLTGFDVEPLNYQIKIYKNYGVDPYIYWHSCYTWLANDVSLYGVPIVMYFVGHFCSLAMTMYRKCNDLLSGIVAVIFANMIIYLFANNNYIAQLFYSFLFLFPYWLITRYFRVR